MQLGDNCVIIFKDKEYTQEQFADYVVENGIGVLTDGQDPTPFIQSITQRYDVTKMDESVLEMRARLNARKENIELDALPTPEDIKRFTIGNGQLTDYSTQEKIRYNTYSGLAITGIAANYGKVLSYLFEMCKITHIINTKNGTIISTDSDEFKKLLEENKTQELERLLELQRHLKPYRRATPTLDKKYWFRVNGTLINGFVRNVRDFSEDTEKMRETYEATLKEIQAAKKNKNKKEAEKLQDKADKLLNEIIQQASDNKNIFETIDTIINLAIDNVKMQGLPHLGITNSNANMFLSLVGMGLPLKVVTKILITPVMVSISEKGRWTSGMLGKELKKRKDNLKELMAQSGEGLSQLSDKETSFLLAFTQGEEFGENDDITKGLLGSVDIDTDFLENIIVGDGDPLRTAIVEAQLLVLTRKMIPVTEELFDYAKIFSTLRGMPNKAWKLDSVIEKVESRATFEDVDAAEKKVLNAMRAMLIENYKKTERWQTYTASLDYQNDLEGAKEAENKHLNDIVDEFMESYGIVGATPRVEVDNAYVNRVLRRSNTRNTVGKNTVFEKDVVSVLRLPHVRAAYRSMLAFRKILQDVFTTHTPVVTRFIKNIVQEANFFSPYDALEKTELVSKEFVKFLTSNLSFPVGNTTLNTSIDEQDKYTTVSGTYFGEEAWKQRLVDNFSKIIDSPGFTENAFLNAIEFKTAFNQETYQRRSSIADIISIRADKMSDPKYKAMIKNDFMDLVRHPDPKIGALALDLLKYAIIADGLYYSQSTFALVFPPSWGVAYGTAVDSRLNMLIPKDKYATDVNLSSMKDKFLYQLLRNRPALVSNPGGKVIVTDRVAGYKGRKKNVYHGVEMVGNEEVHFDLKVDSEFSPTNRKFIKQFNNDIYMLINTPNSKFSYYRKVTEGDYEGTYGINILDIDNGFTLDPLFNTKNRIVNSEHINNEVIPSETSGYKLTIGQTIGAINRRTATSSEIVWYEVTGDNYGNYQLRKKGTQSLLSEKSIVEARKVSAFLFKERTGASMTVSDTKPFIQKALKDDLVVIEDSTEDYVLQLPFYNLPADLTEEQQAEIFDKTIQILDSIPLDKTIIIQENALASVRKYDKLFDQLAKVLYMEANFLEFGAAKPVGNSRKTNVFMESLRRYEMGVKYIDSNVEITPIGEDLQKSSFGKLFHINKIGAYKRMTRGQVLFSGNYYYLVYSHNKDMFNPEGNTLTLLQFESNVFNSLVREIPVNVESFLEEYKKYMNC